jgi:hypothetical protein
MNVGLENTEQWKAYNTYPSSGVVRIIKQIRRDGRAFRAHGADEN